MAASIETFLAVEDLRQLARESGILGFLDRPKPDEHSQDLVLRLVGWALGGDSARAVAVELRSTSGLLERVPLGEERPDLAAAFSEREEAGRAGFLASVALMGMAPLDLVVDAVLEDESRVPLAAVRARRRFGEQYVPGVATLASVVVTATDTEAPLERAIESVLAQTYPNFELVVVNGSGEPAVAEVADRYPAVEVVESRPGAAAARNAGFRSCKGSVVVFLDATERLLPDALEIGLRELAAQPECAFVSGKCVVTRQYHADPEYPQQPLITNDHYAVLLGRNYIISPAAAIIRRAALEAAGGFDEALGALDDYDLYLGMAREFRIGSHPAPVVESPAADPLRADPEAAFAALQQVLERQREYVGENPKCARAFQLGTEGWNDRYGLTLETAGRLERPPVGKVDFGDLRRLSPFSTNFGFERGRPVDRYYIEGFLAEHADDIQGRVLEVQENDYTLEFGGSRVEASDVLSLLPDNPKATVVGDLARAETLPEEIVDCAIVTQVLHLVHDPRDAVHTLRQILKPGGVALVTVPGISQIEWSETWHWSFTVLSAEQMFCEVFGRANVRTHAYGNVLAATSFLWGIAVEELATDELDYFDPNYPVTIAVRAVKSDSV